MSDRARKAPDQASALLEELCASAPEPNRHPTIVIKSKAVAQSIFETSGNLNETIEVVGHVLQRAEMRPIMQSLGYVTKAEASVDSMMVDGLARYISDHLSSAGTRHKEAQAVFRNIIKAAASEELCAVNAVEAAAKRLGVRAATFRLLMEERVKMDAELEHGVEVGGLLKVSRLRRSDAADDEAELWDRWSHRICAKFGP